ncbi:hypothetical protein TEA_010783 [Camellia sinensis var. sinensis]|uniref:S1 motif domain-containing protein n=1 Tax=Camellia sinensis var. sinensis TaxID=542762 RepID=A0A4S4F332_CAMSN|nr:hypothetical protein TEA_010783 [Camellia sinensis var. sinensis]
MDDGDDALILKVNVELGLVAAESRLTKMILMNPGNLPQKDMFGQQRREAMAEEKSSSKPQKSIQEIAKALTGSLISLKVIQADQENRKLIFSEKEAMWSKFSQQINVGDIFEARVGSVEDYGAFVHLLFPDGCYHLTGLVHISEVSWDLVQDSTEEEATSSCPISHREGLGYLSNDKKAANVITYSAVEHFYIEHVEGLKLRTCCREKSRITLSIKQLEEDPLLETLDKVIPQDGSVVTGSSSTSSPYNIEPLPGLQTILEELLREEGISEIRISRQGFEKRVVSQDLQLWLSNAPAIGKQFTLLARAGRQVQEIQLTTSLDQEGIKRALQRVLERVP